MFETFIQIYLESVKTDALDSSHIVRYANIHIYEEILQYCKQNNLMVSNIPSMIASANRLITMGGDSSTPPIRTGGPKDVYTSDILREYAMNIRPMTKFIIYGSYIFKHANTLANILVTNHTQYVELFTTLKNQLFNMKINNESHFITFININTDVIRFVTPIAGKWLSPNIELITIYHHLYSPQFYDDQIYSWATLRKYENDCWKQFVKSHPSKPKSSGNTPMFPYNSIILTWLKNRTDCMLIGPVATTHKNRNNYKAQIITSEHIGKIVDEIKLLLKRLAKIDATTRTYKVEHIPGEYRLSKSIVSYKNNHILEIFNNASYELVPYIEVDNVRVGMPYVLMHNMMLDILFIGTLGSRGTLSQQIVYQIISDYIDVITHVRKNMFDVKMTPFMGVYKDDNLVKKRLGILNDFKPYYPAVYKSANGKYREIV